MVSDCMWLGGLGFKACEWIRSFMHADGFLIDWLVVNVFAKFDNLSTQLRIAIVMKPVLFQPFMQDYCNRLAYSASAGHLASQLLRQTFQLRTQQTGEHAGLLTCVPLLSPCMCSRTADRAHQQPGVTIAGRRRRRRWLQAPNHGGSIGSTLSSIKHARSNTAASSSASVESAFATRTCSQTLSALNACDGMP